LELCREYDCLARGAVFAEEGKIGAGSPLRWV